VSGKEHVLNFDTFISYSSEDKPTADALCHRLETRGVRCWVAPRDILPGRDWATSIIEAMDQVQVMVLLLTVKANNSPQVLREVERAVSKGLIIVPFAWMSASCPKASNITSAHLTGSTRSHHR
jgi:hypothetical protein